MRLEARYCEILYSSYPTSAASSSRSWGLLSPSLLPAKLHRRQGPDTLNQLPTCRPPGILGNGGGAELKRARYHHESLLTAHL